MEKIPAAYPKNERGATAVLVALVMLPLIAITALAIDVGHLYVVRNELQNAADAGALAAAQSLYLDLEEETQVNANVNVEANQKGYDTAIANRSENTPVEVNWSGGNGGDVQRGHWRFVDSTFTPNAITDPVDLWDVTAEELDSNTNFINAVRVRTRREATPAAAFFARIFGYENFGLNAEAVAYIGFAGTLIPFDVDQPIAICRESILQGTEYSCNVGRMINSGGDITTHQTGGWTNFDHDSACNGTNTSELGPLVCGEGNPDALSLGQDMGTNGGEIQAVFDDLIDCWESATGKAEPWGLTLPVISCPGNNVGTCEELRGAVEVNVVWITDGGTDPHYSNAPTEMAGIEDVASAWSSSDPDGEIRWNSFVQHFNLKNVDGTPVPYAKKSIYFLPDCTAHEPAGVTGGENFGILARIPVLVQ